MAGKRRSGRANDQRAYKYATNKTINVATPTCPSITVNTIATLISGNWVLNANTIILACQILTVSSIDILIIPSGLSLTNNGSIINNGEINIATNGTLTNSGTVRNNLTSSFLNQGNVTNSTNLYNAGTIYNVNSMINNGIINNVINGTLINDGILTN